MEYLAHVVTRTDGNLHYATYLRCGFNATAENAAALQRLLQAHPCNKSKSLTATSSLPSAKSIKKKKAKEAGSDD